MTDAAVATTTSPATGNAMDDYTAMANDYMMGVWEEDFGVDGAINLGPDPDMQDIIPDHTPVGENATAAANMDDLAEGTESDILWNLLEEDLPYNTEPANQLPPEVPQANTAGGILCVCGCGLPYKKPGSAQWYLQHLDSPLYVISLNGVPVYTHPVTLRQQLYTILQQMELTTPGRAELEFWLSCMKYTCPLGHYNFSVPTLYMLKKLTEVSAWTTHQYFICDSKQCRGHIFSTKEVEGARLTKCPNCEQVRTLCQDAGGDPKIEPTPYTVYFGVEDAIRELFSDKQWCSERGKFRRIGPDAGGSWWEGTYLKTHLSRPDKLGDAVYSPHNSFYDIGVDWVQPYKSAKYSMGIMFIRCADIKEENKSKNWNCAVIGIIPGPKKPSNLGPHLSRVIDDLDRLSRIPMTVDEVYYGPDGSLICNTISHHAFLGSVMADGPARTDLGCYRGHNSIHGACPWCTFEGATAPESSTARFKGYAKGVTHSSRAKHIYLTSDFGRKYTCVINDRGTWRMEDYLHFTEAIAPYVFMQALPPTLSECWKLLTATVQHYFRPFVADENGDGSVAAFQKTACAGWANLFQYAATIEQLGFPDYMFTINLHTCVCRLFDQEMARGSAAADADFVVERQMQAAKSATGRGVSRFPDKHFAVVECIRRAQRNVKEGADASGVQLRSMQQLFMFFRQADPLHPKCKSQSALDEHTDLIGSSVPLQKDPLLAQEVKVAFERLVKDQAHALESVRSWTCGRPPYNICWEALMPLVDPSAEDATIEGQIATVASRAEWNGDIFFSTLYKRPSARLSYWVLLAWRGLNDQVVPYIGMVKYFTNLPAMPRSSPRGSTTMLTLAIVDLFKGSFVNPAMVEVDMDRALGRKPASGIWRWPLYAVPLELIDGKVIVAAPQGMLKGKMYFTRYYSTSDH
ncbi:hypothetical protein VOLCADRAFT_87564 [Volvox carteri f. nagariensis]|uniref:Uncharacterized protein n=1 Tax=Volvox carteri f. nagariensis TaxID=3068 RepID=D8TLM6_VOLCA|nr:uncharacterized protein VOLCADRAFT_87564 [Volvox carteri f. nagariensis]EFJ51490.1 hypothetical protein VOLCADRAFT_87564 [Volvox carteri f. nagariensis]|eukprot:XP_002947442.1 hypothetical protein VOLCADRAFT_87564 [Volvox carteri f. nagariensis]